MFDSVKEALNKDINPSDVKKFLEMEVEIKKLKELLETEVKLKEFLLQEVDVKRLMPANAKMSVKHFNDRRSDDRNRSMSTPSSLLPAYDLGLIKTLQKDHQELLFIYAGLMTHAENKKYELVVEQLSLFSERFTEYFHVADRGLYGYLKTYIKLKQPKRQKAFSALNLEMKNLYLSIFYSLNQSSNVPFNENSYEGFIEEFRFVGEQLKERIEREESVLFKMYEESHQAKDILSEAV